MKRAKTLLFLTCFVIAFSAGAIAGYIYAYSLQRSKSIIKVIDDIRGNWDEAYSLVSSNVTGETEYKAICRCKVMLGEMCEFIGENLCAVPEWWSNNISSCKYNSSSKSIYFDFYVYVSTDDVFQRSHKIHNDGLFAGRKGIKSTGDWVSIDGYAIMPFDDLGFKSNRTYMYYSSLVNGKDVYFAAYGADDDSIVVCMYNTSSKRNRVIDRIILDIRNREPANQLYRCELLPIKNGSGFVLFGASHILNHLTVYEYGGKKLSDFSTMRTTSKLAD